MGYSPWGLQRIRPDRATNTGRVRSNLGSILGAGRESLLAICGSFPGPSLAGRFLVLSHATPLSEALLSHSLSRPAGAVKPASIQVVLVVKNPPVNAGDVRDVGSIPGSGQSPGGGHGNPLQYSCLKNPMERGTWWTIVHGVTRVGHD